MILALLTISLLMSINLMIMSHPVSFSLITLIQAIVIALLTSSLSYTSWFSYIIFLIMVGAMLILFLYMTSVASNEKFNFSFKILILSAMLAIIPIMVKTHDPSMFTTNSMMLKFLSEYHTENQMNKLVSLPTNKILTGLIMYLLICLIAVVKITNPLQGPLRQKF
uniref:NADH-ubiquinone oxidoreductase chain 6 n=1 Tax=Apoderinae sp. 2 AV-2018 TaxID=2480750 RepID=A0A3G2JZC0_9CUCU|nr:NADH dehydrogenase subunit 6 [Apoderinae sp. 2 AV-2018]